MEPNEFFRRTEHILLKGNYYDFLFFLIAIPICFVIFNVLSVSFFVRFNPQIQPGVGDFVAAIVVNFIFMVAWCVTLKKFRKVKIKLKGNKSKQSG